MRLLLCLLAALAVPTAAHAQSPAAALEQARQQMVSVLIAQGLSAADAAYVAACSTGETDPDGDACDPARVERIMNSMAPEIPDPPPEPEETVPEDIIEAEEEPALPPMPDLPDTSTASVRMEGVPAMTFDGYAYVTPNSEEFAVLAIASGRLIPGPRELRANGTWDLPETGPFSMIEVRLYGGLREETRTTTRGVGFSVHNPDGSPMDGPNYRVTESTITVSRIVRNEAGLPIRAIGALDFGVDVMEPDGTVTGRQRLQASFEAVPGKIPPP
ncbi:MAG: hypothetical protein AAGI52_03500 [Bacteroidota bacterium]